MSKGRQIGPSGVKIILKNEGRSVFPFKTISCLSLHYIPIDLLFVYCLGPERQTETTEEGL